MRVQAEGLIKTYKKRQVVSNVSLNIHQGEIVGLLGPNGAGKTTTFYMITGLVHPDTGSVKFDEKEVTTWPMYKRAQAGIGYLPQENSIFRRLTVEDNIRLVMEVNKATRQEIKETTERLAEELHIGHILARQGAVLSGGERRRVEIARALATKPKFIFLDEPFAGIDPVTIEEIQSILFKLRAQQIGILLTDHNVSATLKITNRNFILVDGKIIAHGTATEITANELVRKHYLGQQFEN